MFFFKELDALLLTSERESLPTVVLEAMAREIPVFSFEDVSGVQEMMGKAALTVKRRRGTDMAEEIIRFFLHPEFHKNFQGWRETVRRQSELFSLERQWRSFKESVGIGCSGCP